jgi:hypothetical protein
MGEAILQQRNSNSMDNTLASRLSTFLSQVFLWNLSRRRLIGPQYPTGKLAPEQGFSPLLIQPYYN